MSKVHYFKSNGGEILCHLGCDGDATSFADNVTCKFCLKRLPKQLIAEARSKANWAGAIFVHPLTGEKARPGKAWVKSIFGDWCQESPDTPWTCSVQSETYWSS